MKQQLICAGLLFLMSCSVPSPYMQDTKPTEPPAINEAKVIFYRTDITGNAEPFSVYVDQKLVGYPERGRYFEVHCRPGEHVFYSPGAASLPAWPQRADAVVLARLDQGKTYYIQAWSSGGGCGGTWARLKPLTRENSRWGKIDKIISKLQCRHLGGEGKGNLSEVQPVAEWPFSKDAQPSSDAPRLQPEDGR